MKFRFAVIAAVFVACLAPSTALADANPNNNGNHYHYGWVNHHSPPSAPVGGAANGPNPNSLIATIVPPALAPQAPTVVPPETPVLVPPGDIVTTAQPLAAGGNVWLVAILLAAVLAANVTLAVLATARGGHYAIRRSLAPVGIRI